jgi:hypothetical protein
MIISHKHKLAFIHIPKNAGTFTSKILEILDPECIDVRTPAGLGHQTMAEIELMDVFKSIKDYTFFCILRSPLDKIISSYNYYYYKFYDFNTFLSKLPQVEINSGHISNLKFITKNNFSIYDNIKLCNINNLTEDIASLFPEGSINADLLLRKNNSANLNSSIKKVTTLTSRHMEIINTFDFCKREIEFWNNFKK